MKNILYEFNILLDVEVYLNSDVMKKFKCNK